MLRFVAILAAVGLAKVEDPVSERIALVTSKSFEERVKKDALLWNFTSPTREFMELRMQSMGGLNIPTEEEMERLRKSEHEFIPPASLTALPVNFDARSRGCTGGLRNQAGCGGCWAFGAAETFTDNYCHYDHYIVDLSEQDLISCAYTCNGCHGGGLQQTWEWIQSRGIATEGCLPFTSANGIQGQCPNICQTGDQIQRYRCGRYQHYSSNTDMMQGIYGYNAAEVQFSVYNNFFGYSGGIYTGAAGTKYAGDHAVKAVGWGSQNGVQYWIIQNSWGPGWGENGYARIQKGVVNIGAYGMFNCPIGNPSMTSNITKIPQE